MTTIVKGQGKAIADHLGVVMKIYHMVLEMDLEEQERIILERFVDVCKDIEKFASVRNACESTLRDYPKGFPHDSTLIDEARSRVTTDYKNAFPNDLFDRDMLIYGWFDSIIKAQFMKIKANHELARSEELIIEKLQRGVHNTLVNNPNFKGSNPYYKRNYSDYERSKKLSLELLDDDFNNYIQYFNEE